MEEVLRAGLKVLRHGGISFLTCQELEELQELISERLSERQFDIRVYSSESALKRGQASLYHNTAISINPGDSIISSWIKNLSTLLEEVFSEEENNYFKLKLEKQIKTLSSIKDTNPFPCFKIEFPWPISCRRRLTKVSIFSSPENFVYGVIIPVKVWDPNE